jgi:hypothetical protein
VDHRPGAHDDRANAVAGACTLAALYQRGGLQIIDVFTGDLIHGVDSEGRRWAHGEQIRPPDLESSQAPVAAWPPIRTGRIVAPNDPGSYVVINEADFDPAVHRLYDAAAGESSHAGAAQTDISVAKTAPQQREEQTG